MMKHYTGFCDELRPARKPDVFWVTPHIYTYIYIHINIHTDRIKRLTLLRIYAQGKNDSSITTCTGTCIRTCRLFCCEQHRLLLSITHIMNHSHGGLTKDIDCAVVTITTERDERHHKRSRSRRKKKSGSEAHKKSQHSKHRRHSESGRDKKHRKKDKRKKSSSRPGQRCPRLTCFNYNHRR